MIPSFSRTAGTPFDVPNPNPTTLTNPAPWLNTSDPALKYLVLRPRPADNYYNTTNAKDPHNFPLPASDTGDVQNLVGGVGNRQLLDGPGLSRAERRAAAPSSNRSSPSWSSISTGA